MRLPSVRARTDWWRPTSCSPRGFGYRVLARRILGRREMEGRNADVVGDAIAAALRWCIRSWSSDRCGAWPHGACGMNAERAALARARAR